MTLQLTSRHKCIYVPANLGDTMTSQPTAMPGTVHRLEYDSCYDAKHTHAQDFVANDELLCSILNHTLLGILTFLVCVH
jgi:hypothetical protein